MAAARLKKENCLSIIIDVQPFFLDTLATGPRHTAETQIQSLVRLVQYLKVPTVFTIERPLPTKGRLPAFLEKEIRETTPTLVLEKDFFDLTKHFEIVSALQKLKKTQVIVAGSETDVCILQSCLGLLDLGFEVFAVEDALFSSTGDTSSALARLRSSGVTLVTYKTLFHELMEAQEASAYRVQIAHECGPAEPPLADN